MALTNEVEQAIGTLRLQGNTGAQALEQAREKARLNACIANLKQIDGATQQWALENRKRANDLVDVNKMREYLKGSMLPLCPSGGAYNVITVRATPTCSVHSGL